MWSLEMQNAAYSSFGRFSLAGVLAQLSMRKPASCRCHLFQDFSLSS